MKLKIESRTRRLRYSLMVGAIAAAGLAATPALADMIVQQTTSYANPPGIVVDTPTPPVVVQAPAPTPTVTYTYAAPPATYVQRTETVTTVPAPPVSHQATVEVVQDTPKYDFTVHKRVQTAQVQTRAHTHKAAPRCQCQPTQ